MPKYDKDDILWFSGHYYVGPAKILTNPKKWNESYGWQYYILLPNKSTVYNVFERSLSLIECNNV